VNYTFIENNIKTLKDIFNLKTEAKNKKNQVKTLLSTSRRKQLKVNIQQLTFRTSGKVEILL